MQSANKAFSKNILFYKSKDVPWEVKCQRLVDHVYAVFAFGIENWSWIVPTLDKVKGWETKTMIRLFRFKRQRRNMGRSPYMNVQCGQEDNEFRWACPSCMK